MRVLLLLLGLIVPAFTVGDIYKYISPDGTVEYSDRPRRGATKMEVIPLQTYTPPAPLKTEMLQEGKLQKTSSYSYQVTLVKPQDGATIRSNTGEVEIAVQVEPPLEKDSSYAVQLLLDGQKIGKLNPSGEYTLSDVDRGTHTLQAKLLTPAGKAVVRTSPVTFYMKRMSILFHPPSDGKGQSGGVQRAPRALQMPKMPGSPNAGGVTFP